MLNGFQCNEHKMNTNEAHRKFKASNNFEQSVKVLYNVHTLTQTLTLARLWEQSKGRDKSHLKNIASGRFDARFW